MEWLSRSALVLALIAITLLSLLPVPAPPVEGIDKAEHLFAYLTLAALADFSFSRSGFSWRKWLPLFVYGVLMEFLQDQLPHRYFSVNDMIANGAPARLSQAQAGRAGSRRCNSPSTWSAIRSAINASSR